MWCVCFRILTETSEAALENNAPWTASISAHGFANTRLWRDLKQILVKVILGAVGEREGELQLGSLTGYVLRWGDQLKPDLGDKNDVRMVMMPLCLYLCISEK